MFLLFKFGFLFWVIYSVPSRRSKPPSQLNLYKCGVGGLDYVDWFMVSAEILCETSVYPSHDSLV